jgi:hypothetical protein
MPVLEADVCAGKVDEQLVAVLDRTRARGWGRFLDAVVGQVSGIY